MVARSRACSDGFRCCLSAVLRRGFGTENGNEIVCEGEGKKQEQTEKRKRAEAYKRSEGLVKFRGTVGPHKLGKRV